METVIAVAVVLVIVAVGAFVIHRLNAQQGARHTSVHDWGRMSDPDAEAPHTHLTADRRARLLNRPGKHSLGHSGKA